MSRLLLVLALAGALACKSKSAHDEPAPAGTRAAAIAGAPASEGHQGMQDAAQAFANALATGDATKVRSEMPPRAVLAKYFACDAIVKRIDKSAEEALTLPSVAPKGGRYIGIEDTQTHVIEDELDGCRVAEQILVVEAVTKWKVDDQVQTSALQLIRLGDRWYTFDVPAN